jgi:hypothetical protein
LFALFQTMRGLGECRPLANVWPRIVVYSYKKCCMEANRSKKKGDAEDLQGTAEATAAATSQGV